MMYEDFERAILKMVYEEGMTHLQPSYLAYALGLPHEQITEYLQEAMAQNVLEMNFSDEGHIDYYVPGFDQSSPLPTPLWKQPEFEPQQVVQPEPAPVTIETHTVVPDDDADGYVRNVVAHQPRRVVIEEARPNRPILSKAQKSTSTAMVPYAPQQMMATSDDEAFCDPTKTIFMRQLHVNGVQSEALLHDHIQRLFESFGYKIINHGQDRMRFERGSVTFILALVPLFVLIVPLFVYLFLYCLGRSTIQQEPLSLDVHIKRGQQAQSYDIDLTFVGKHGVVLGSADQRVLNQEIDTLRDELNWALTGS